MSISDLPVLTAGFPTFHPFSRLPPELRILIWHAALPEIDPPAMSPYQAGCWRPVPVTESEQEDTFHLASVEMELHHELLDPIRVKTPLTAVSHEARSVAIEWALKQGIEVQFHEGRQGLIFLRTFDPMRDVIWFGQDSLEAFAKECWGVHALANDPRQTLTVPIDTGSFAISERVLMEDASLNFVLDAIHCFSGDTVMYVIAGEHPSFDIIHGNCAKAQPRWEIDDSQKAKALAWNRHKKRFDVKSPNCGREILHALCYNRVLEASQMVSELPSPSGGERTTAFEIRPVYAVRL
ncbi:hypothetical protein N7517_008061 [Penicillium concentricum]|uniref:2EXR domain-containing protein n=1 Tax=Penicillium concentricum TaxID=293559 RepID=A0A9W9RT54_9EURO|nr:uncharacterized protein N7517_008061 [Penicillium concentricum]KAJ5365175.1 hypothetical protein N7517_008061 [Penicillium concentricum]